MWRRPAAPRLVEGARQGHMAVPPNGSAPSTGAQLTVPSARLDTWPVQTL